MPHSLKVLNRAALLPQTLYPWRRVLREMFHHDRLLGQMYCLKDLQPTVVSGSLYIQNRPPSWLHVARLLLFKLLLLVLVLGLMTGRHCIPSQA
jgi:hypothetical protein